MNMEGNLTEIIDWDDDYLLIVYGRCDICEQPRYPTIAARRELTAVHGLQCLYRIATTVGIQCGCPFTVDRL